MQNNSNFPFYFIPNTLPIYTYVPLTPSSSNLITPPSGFSANPSPPFPLSSYFQQNYYQNNHRGYVTQPQPSPADDQDQIIQNSQQNNEDNQRNTTQDPQVVKQELPVLKVEENAGPKVEQQSQPYIYKTIKPLKSKRQPKKIKLAAPDHDYFPQKKKAKKQVYKYQVSQSRNIVPNEINQIFSFVQHQNKSGYLTERLFQKYPSRPEFTIKRFYHYQSLLKNRLGRYCNERTIKMMMELYDPQCENWSEQEQRYYSKICRILIHHFLHEDSIFIILTSRRMNRDKKSDHLRARREVARAVGQVLKGSE